MALQRLQFKPGVNRDQTNYAGEGGYYECDKIRFRSGFPQKIGGWLRTTTFTLIGVCRQMYNYVTTASDNILALGTNKKLYLETGGNLVNITPLRAVNPTFTTPTTDNCIDVSNGSNIATLSFTGAAPVVGNYVQISGVVGPIGGIPAADFNGNFEILSVPTTDTFTIQVATTATSTVSNAGGTAITVSFEIDTGPAVTTYGYGWGASPWGGGVFTGWGGGALTPLTLFQQDWFFDNFDNDLIANIRNGPIYTWVYNPSFNTRAVLLSSVSGASDVPDEAMQILVSQNDKHLLAFGATPYGGGSFDPLLIRWANQNEPENWTPTPTNSAGFLRVSRGSRIIRAIPTRQETLVWTDSHLYSLQFLGTTDVFGLQELADNISIASPRAGATANNVTYWMGTDKFYMYSGRVETMPCTLRNYVFNDLNFDQLEQIICGTNEGWQEVWWFYPSANSQVNNRYVIFNYFEGVWYYGSIERTAWLDSPLREYPQAVSNNYLYDHERGVNDDTSAMTSFITTNDFDIGDGENLLLIKRILPDINFNGSTAASPRVFMTMRPRNFPGSNYSSTNNPDVTLSSTIPVEQYTEQIFIRARARQMGFKILSDEIDVQWQLGAPRLDGRPDGKR
jgi:hypothetical protein